MMKYIDYCRKKIAPRLSDAAATVLRNHYVRIRKDMRHRTQENDATVPITVRQLEAITRIAEARAKMSLRAEVSGPTSCWRLFRLIMPSNCCAWCRRLRKM